MGAELLPGAPQGWRGSRPAWCLPARPGQRKWPGGAPFEVGPSWAGQIETRWRPSGQWGSYSTTASWALPRPLWPSSRHRRLPGGLQGLGRQARRGCPRGLPRNGLVLISGDPGPGGPHQPPSGARYWDPAAIRGAVQALRKFTRDVHSWELDPGHAAGGRGGSGKDMPLGGRGWLGGRRTARADPQLPAPASQAGWGAVTSCPVPARRWRRLLGE